MLFKSSIALTLAAVITLANASPAAIIAKRGYASCYLNVTGVPLPGDNLPAGSNLTSEWTYRTLQFLCLKLLRAIQLMGFDYLIVSGRLFLLSVPQGTPLTVRLPSQLKFDRNCTISNQASPILVPACRSAERKSRDPAWRTEARTISLRLSPARL